MNKTPVVATHSGTFHADDVFAVATLELLLGENSFEVVRTRDADVAAQADWAVDVGGEYDPARKRFDHHQTDRPFRDNGVPYAAFGLVWKEFGTQLCDGDEEVANVIDETLVQDIDAWDSGSHAYLPKPFHPTLRPTTLDNLVQMFRPPWGEEGNPDDYFREAVDFARKILKRTIAHGHGEARARKLVREAISNYDGGIPIFDVGIPLGLFPEDTPFDMAIMPHEKAKGSWVVLPIRKHPREFPTRVLFPAQWAGLRNGELQKASGVPDAIFCHATRTSAYALSIEGALTLAKQALPNETSE